MVHIMLSTNDDSFMSPGESFDCLMIENSAPNNKKCISRKDNRISMYIL